MFNNLTVKARLFSLISLMLVIMLALTGLNLYALHNTNQGLHTVYTDRTIPLADLAEIKIKQIDIRLKIADTINNPTEIERSLGKISKINTEIDNFWESYLQTSHTPEEKILTNKFVDARNFYATEYVNPILELLKNRDVPSAQKLVVEKGRRLFLPISDAIDGLIQLQKDVAKQEYDSAQQRYELSLIFSIGFLMAGVFLSVFVSFKIINQLMAKLGGDPAYVADLVRQISNGDLSAKVPLLRNDKNSLLYSITRMRDELNNAIVSVNITMSEIAQGDLNSRITGEFKGDFCQIKTGMNSSLEIIGETLNEVMRVTNAIANGDLKQKITGEYQGAFGKTKDSVNDTVDALSKLVEEIDSIVHAGADFGNFSVKMTMLDKVGYGERLAELINQLFSTTEKSLNDVLRVAEALAEGDLTQTIDNDYIGAFAAVKTGMNATVEHLKNLIGEIKATSDVIASASNEISVGNNDLSHRTEEQSCSLQQTAANMEALSTVVQQNTNNAKRSTELAVGASSIAKKGVDVVNGVVKTMVTINESSRKIVDIISTIDGIAFQTNILALNAAVEAARAGEQGRGFAVVASEVRNLAQRAASAAGEIKHLISDSVENIADGSDQVEQAGKTMKDIVSAIQNLTMIMSEIAAASIEQNTGINQVHDAVAQMDAVTQQNTALVEEVAAAAESLKEQTRNLATEMAHFKTRK